MSFIRWAFRVIWKRIQQTSTWERTETVLLSVTEALQIAKAYSKSSVLILLHLSAAFDSVNHQILLTTLSSLGITGIILNWLESYLNGRSFKVAWGGEVSTEHQLITGVPQGSVLGPLLFSTYTTSPCPMIQAHGFSYHCYTDDTQLYLSFRADDPTVAARISGCLVDISAWMKHHLQLNLAKTELLVFPATPTLQHDFTIQLGSSTITLTSSVINLGVIFDDQLTFKDFAKTALVQALVIYRLDYCNALLARLPLLPLTQNLHPLQKSEICKRDKPRGAITERHKITLLNVFIHRSWLVEWSSQPHPECWIPNNFQAAPENSSLPSSLNLIFKKIKYFHSLSLTLISFP